GDAALRIGGSRIDARGSLTDRLLLDARLAPLDLADLLPDATGSLRGTLQMQGARTAPDVEADLQGTGLRWGDYAASSLRVQGRLPWSRGNGQLVIEGSGLNAGVALDQMRIDARGAVEDLRL